MMDLTNPRHAPSIEFQKMLMRKYASPTLQREEDEKTRVAAMSEEDRLRYLSQKISRECRKCYGRGHVGKDQAGAFVLCGKCTGRSK